MAQLFIDGTNNGDAWWVTYRSQWIDNTKSYYNSTTNCHCRLLIDDGHKQTKILRHCVQNYYNRISKFAWQQFWFRGCQFWSLATAAFNIGRQKWRSRNNITVTKHMSKWKFTIDVIAVDMKVYATLYNSRVYNRAIEVEWCLHVYRAMRLY